MTRIDREYAEALFALSAENGEQETFLDSLRQLRSLIEEDPEYLMLLASPAIPLSERCAILDEAFSNCFPEHIVSFLKLLCENARIGSLPDCIEAFEMIARDLSSHRVANITSAVSLSESQKEALLLKLESLVGKKIDPIFVVDSALIGGVQVEVDGKIYDGSVRGRLQEVKDVLNR